MADAGAENFRLEVGHRYRTTSVPRPSTRFSGVVDVRFLACDPERTLSVRWFDPDPAGLAHWTITWTLEHEGRGTRLFLVHEWFDLDDPARMMACTITDGGRRSHVWAAPGQTLEQLRKAVVKAVSAGTPPVHVHLLMQLHVNRVMIRVS
ncbi:SRPBCC domain-containing protein [Streptomyces sp. NPDC054813]